MSTWGRAGSPDAERAKDQRGLGSGRGALRGQHSVKALQTAEQWGSGWRGSPGGQRLRPLGKGRRGGPRRVCPPPPPSPAPAGPPTPRGQGQLPVSVNAASQCPAHSRCLVNPCYMHRKSSPFVPGIVLRVPLRLQSSPRSPRGTAAGKTAAQRGKVTRLRSHSWCVVEQGGPAV